MSDINPYDLSSHGGLPALYKPIDSSAGGYPERTYVGKNTTVADLNNEIMRWKGLYTTLEYQYDQKCTEVKDLEAKVKELEERVETLEGWIENW